MNYRNKFVLILLSTVFVFYAVVGGLLGRVTAKEGAYSQLNVFNEVLSRIRSSYVEDPDLTEVMHGALRGLLESLDPYSTFLTRDEYERYRKHLTNGNGDLGLELSKERVLGYVYVIHPIEGAAANQAGVKAGDVIESIEGVSTRDISLVQASYLLTGEPGSPVKLKILRRGSSDPIELVVARQPTKVPPVRTAMMEGRIGYLKVYRFLPGSGDEVKNKLTALMKNGASKVILDLRNCAGDTFEEATKVANLFLDHGIIVYTQGQKSPRVEYVADPAKAICKLPLVVLQNYGSAAAAEIVSAGIKENRRGELVGVRTFGKASLQKLIPLESEAAILLSTTKFYSQSGKVIQGNGISPDHEVKDGLEAAQEFEGAEDSAPDSEAAPPSQEDLQLKKAIELLNTEAVEPRKAA
ncbi:MAG: S41 family peptidase [Acidobacteriota bacterium]